MTKPWFGVHRYWGWYPQTAQGYAIIALMFLGFLSVGIYSYLGAGDITQGLIEAIPALSLVFALTLLIISLEGAKPAFGHKDSPNYSRDNPSAYLVFPFLFLATAVLFVWSYLQLFAFALVILLLLQVYRNITAKE